MKAAVPVIRKFLAKDSSEIGIAGGKSASKSIEAAPVVNVPAKGFASEKLLNKHFEKHGDDFDVSDADSYLSAAEGFMNKNPSASILEKVRADGDRVRFDRSTNEFGIVTPGGVLRTYYKPVSGSGHDYPTNLDYFNAQ
jgi:filamentous hemagglutinin